MINEIKPGQVVEDFFVLRKIECRTQKEKGTVYLSLELGDASGRIFGSLWHNVKKTSKVLKEGDIVKLKAKTIDWKGKPHLSIDRIRLANENDKVETETLVAKAHVNPALCYQKLIELINTIEEKNLRTLLSDIYQDDSIKNDLFRAPAGKLWHHCYEGGLLEHTLNVCRIVESVAGLFHHIDRDLLLTGALLHDIGKINEFITGNFIEYSDEGRLCGHISIGYHIVASFIEKIEKFPPALQNKILHLILSHQGQQDHGSPVVPMSREAFILYYADEMDSKLDAFERIFNKEKSQNKNWSSYVKLMDRFFYFGDNMGEHLIKKDHNKM
ncbi:HD domain-containing protein [candidate division KSB1 bacterium]|nr:HD domain-containing protein [candidate division KSB1 bacterium]